MQLFLSLNDLAGRWLPLDALMRGVYIATIPILAIGLLGLLVLAPRGWDRPSRGRIALACVLALLGAAGVMWGVGILAQSLNLGTISPRPFMTRWVNLLIVEPQDNSFPCAEVMVAAILALGIGFAHRGWGVVAGVLVGLLGVARLFCGSNYGADVAVGALLGAGLMLCALALCRAPRERRVANASWGAGALGLTALGTFMVGAGMPRFERQLQLPWARDAVAASPKELAKNATVAARASLQEGEGMGAEHSDEANPEAGGSPYLGEADALALSKRKTLFLPQAESALRRVLEPRALPFVLIDVEVAPVNWNHASYRAAALRFKVEPNTPDARRLVANRAATLVKAAFAADARLDNVDVVAIMQGDARTIDGSPMNFAGDEVPIFSASVQRKNLIVKAPRWANDPRLDAGLWLRARSRLWVNDRVLPVVSAPKPASPPLWVPPLAPTPLAPTPLVTPTPAARPTAKPTPIVRPTSAMTALPGVPPKPSRP